MRAPFHALCVALLPFIDRSSVSKRTARARRRTGLWILPLVLAFSGTAAAQFTHPHPDKQPSKISGALREAVQPGVASSRTAGADRDELKRAFPLASDEGLIPIRLVEASEGSSEPLLELLGRTVANRLGEIVEAYVSLDDVRELASASAVRSIEAIEPDRPQVISQGTQAHNAARWHAGGHVGAGVKVGIMDSFEGILQLMGNELPATVVARCYTSVGVHSSAVAACDGGNNHGSAVAESLVDIAPAVQLYIANPISRVDQWHTVQWMLSNGVKIINYSASWPWDGPGNGTSPYSDSPLRWVDAAVSGGAVVVTSAGNQGESTWFGAWQDTDGDRLHEFSGADYNNIYVLGGETVHLQLRWNDSWQASTKDLDLYVYDSNLNTVWASESSQSGFSGDTPFEYLSFTAPYSGLYWLVVERYAGAPPSWLQVQVRTNQPLAVPTGGSIGNPAETANPGALAVGAANWATPNVIESYSNTGPSPDGRIKPDLVGVDRADTFSMGPGGFPGTSQASPHVAGLAALVAAARPAYTPAEIANYLKYFAEPRGGINNTWGYGLARLPDLCSFTATPTNVNAPAAGGPVQVNVTTQPGCAWSTGSQAGWLTFQGGSGNGSGASTIQVAGNSGAARTGTVTVAGVTVTVIQAAAAPTSLPAPQNFGASAGGTLVTFTWQAVPAATGYILEAGTGPGRSDLAAAPLPPVNSFVVAVPNGTYYVRVRATAGLGVSAPSNEVVLRVGGTAPGPVGLLSAQLSGADVTFSWTPPGAGGAPTHYLLEAGSAPGLTNIAVVPVSSPGFFVPGVPPGTYYVRVRAANGAGVGPASNEVTLVVAGMAAPGTPGPVQVTVVGSTVTLGWSPDPVGAPASGYILHAGMTPGTSFMSMPVTSAGFATTGVPPGTYYVRVQAVNSAGASAPTADAVAVVHP